MVRRREALTALNAIDDAPLAEAMMERCMPDWRAVWRAETLASPSCMFDNRAGASSYGMSNRLGLLCVRAGQMLWSVDE